MEQQEGASMNQPEGTSKELQEEKSKEWQEGSSTENQEGTKSELQEGASIEKQEATSMKQQEETNSEQQEEKSKEQQEGTSMVNQGGTKSELQEGASLEQQEGTNIEQLEGANIEQQEGTSMNQQEGTNIEQQEGTSMKQQEEKSKEQQRGTSMNQQEGTNSEQQEGESIEQQDGTKSEQQDGTKSAQQDGTKSEQQDGTKSEQQEGTCMNQQEETSVKPQEGTSMEQQEETGAGPLELVPSSTTTATLVGEIYIKFPKEKLSCYIHGIAIVSPNRVVLSDYINMSVKLVDLNKKAVIAYLSLGPRDNDNRPTYITTTGPKQVAVTVPGRQRIKFIFVSDKLRKTNEIQTNGDCFGLCCYQNKLIVSYRESRKIETLDMKGKVTMTVTLPAVGKGAHLAQPDCIQANSESIYISDNHFVVILNWEGEITGLFKGMIHPSSIGLLNDGTVLVIGCKDGGMCQMSADGKYQRSVTVQKDVLGSSTLCVNTARQELYFSRFTNGLDEVSNNLVVYSFKTM